MSGVLENKEATFEEFAFELVDAYVPDTLAAETLLKTATFTVSSMVAGGKGTICDILKAEDFCAVALSHTTRDPEPRDGMEPGTPDSYPVAYSFVDVPHMAGKLLAREMLEVAVVHGNVYGTSLEALESVAKSGRCPLLEIDLQGVENLKAVAPTMPSFFIVPPGVDVWLSRWSSRDPEITKAQFTKRVQTAQQECRKAIAMVYDESLTLISNGNAQFAADSIRAAVSDGIVANQATRLLDLSDFADNLDELSESGELWQKFKAIVNQKIGTLDSRVLIDTI